MEYEFKKGIQSGMISDCFAEDGFLFFIQKSYVLSEDKNKACDTLSLFLKKIHDDVFGKPLYTFADFQKIIDDTIALHFSKDKIDGVCIVIRGDSAGLFTVGNGKIFLQRDKDCALIISGSQYAIGKAYDDDLFVCMFSQITSFEVQKKLSADDRGDIFAQFDTAESAVLVRVLNEKNEKTPISNDIIVEQRNKLHASVLKNKKYTFIAVGVLCVILIWSVGFGVKRRMDQLFKKEIASYTLKITESLQHAQEKAVQNNNEALALVNQAQKDLETFKGIVGTRKIPNIQELSSQIADIEKKIMKKEEKKYDEFYDLVLIEKDAHGDIVSFDSDTLAVLDKNKGAVYMISFSKKSTHTIKKSEIRGSSLMYFHNKILYLYKENDGLYIIDKEEKLMRAIEKDSEWGHIVSFSVYNGNIYFLDGDKNNVYKYLVADTGYSSKQSYLKKEQGVRFENAHSIAIDSSVYVGTDRSVYKYTSGLMDGFSAKMYGQKTPLFAQLFTDTTVKKVYVLDKEQGTLYIFSKQGSFEKQIESSILRQTSSFIVREKNQDAPDIPSGIFIVAKNKIYTISLE